MFTWSGHQPDAKEGVVAFLERRPPVWSNSLDDLPSID
jgi:enoyl-CoA hydratase/carnithine racemase